MNSSPIGRQLWGTMGTMSHQGMEDPQKHTGQMRQSNGTSPIKNVGKLWQIMVNHGKLW